jgi:hypothetical protein
MTIEEQLLCLIVYTYMWYTHATPVRKLSPVPLPEKAIQATHA